jgi:5-hydroxyisourate hydrolase
MSLSTHVLDTSTGRPAVGLAVRLESVAGVELASGVTDTDGRLHLPAVEAGTYRLVFATGAWFTVAALYPRVCVEFIVRDAEEHHHVPLLLSPFGYSTYRGT